MAKKKRRGLPRRRRGGDGGGGDDAGRRGPLPAPNVTSPESGDDPAKFGEAGPRGMVMNPVYAGVGDYPRMVPDDQWVAAARRVLEADGPGAMVGLPGMLSASVTYCVPPASFS